MDIRARPGTVFVARDYCALPYLYSISNEVKGIKPSLKTRYAAGLFLFGRQLVPIIAEPAKQMDSIQLPSKKDGDELCQLDAHRPNAVTVSGPPNDAMLHNVMAALRLGMKKNGNMVFSVRSPYPGEITVVLESPNAVIISGLLYPSEIGVLMECCELYITDPDKTSINIERPMTCMKCIEDVVTSTVEEVRETAYSNASKDFNRIRFVPDRPRLVVTFNIISDDQI